MYKLIGLFAFTFLSCVGAFAKGELLEIREITFSYYFISGNSFEELRNQLDNNQATDEWAHTKTDTKWTGDCKVSFFAEVILPRLANSSALSEPKLHEFERMVEALKAHEMRHVDIGLYFAEEIKRRGCPQNSAEINEYWRSKDRELDLHSSHGQMNGVFLPSD